MLVGVLGHAVVGEELLEDRVPGRGPGAYAAREFHECRTAVRAQQIGLRVEAAARGVDDVGGVCHVRSSRCGGIMIK